MIEAVEESLSQLPVKIEVQKASAISLEDLKKPDLIIFGSSTWADGDLHEDFDKLERDMRDLDLSNKYGAVLGSGNSRFRYYCEAVDVLETRLKHCNVKILLPSLKSDVMEKRMVEEAVEWGEKLKEKVQGMLS